MPDICIYYSKEDKQRVEWLGNHLKSFGWDVWWYDYNNIGKWPSHVESKTKESKCVIPIWTNTSIDSEKTVVNETQFAKDNNIPILPVRMDNVVLPIQFNLENTTDLFDWNGKNNHQGLEELTEKLMRGAGLQNNKWDGRRPATINLLGKQLKLPCFVKSLSSHETQFDTEAGLAILNVFPDVDALLVSAYDMHLRDDPNAKQEERKKQRKKHEFMREKLKELDERGALILLDSGNYEKSRKDDKTWNEEDWNSVLESTPYTYAFCYDDLEPNLDVQKNVDDVIASIKGKHECFLIPILHAPIDGKNVRIHKILPDIFFEYASRKNSPFIAVPERELGEGICEKAKTIIEIRKRLNTLDRYQPIHILGTGNPLSLLILAAAGADLFDGLEWCRTVADKKTGFLFHHQQFDFFKNQTINNPRYPLIKEVLERDDISLTLKMALHNLEFFLEWMEQLQTGINTNSIREMIKDRAVFGTHDFVGELKNLMPRLFK